MLAHASGLWFHAGMYTLGRPGNLILLAVVLAPVLLATWSGGIQPPEDAATWLGLIGRLSGVLGLTLMLVAAIISIRIPGMDLPFGGLVELWKVHHWLGTGAFLSMLAHPLLLAFSALPDSAQAAAAVLWPAGGLPGWLGWGALLLSMIFLAPSFWFFGTPHYQRWKYLHALAAPALALGFAHTVLLGRSVPAALWWLLGALAVIALAFRLGWRKLVPGRRYVITRVDSLADRVVELSLSPVDGPQMKFRVGQFVYLAPLDPQLANGRREEHPYTIASAPGKPELRIGIKAFGDASKALQTVATGSEAMVDGPYGQFFEPGLHGLELWIGGGIGITPFVSRARAWQQDASAVDVQLVYCANDPGRAYYLEDFKRATAVAQGLRVATHYFRDEGPLNIGWLQAHCPDAASRTWYVCGPQPLLEIANELRRKLGVPRRRFRSENFDLL